METTTWWVWRRSDGCVATTDANPRELFDDTYHYYIIVVTEDENEAMAAAMMAISLN